ncbi:5'-AMP-activated protein kinase subunit gamma-3 [Schistosoma japonicum]|nr:5'-AMP-activated protein kinase subunit gamma-3 [Schistosoma japonicum]
MHIYIFVYQIGKAFKALIYNGIRAAPVWNSENQNFISMLTVTDFVQMLNFCWNPVVSSNCTAELKNMQIDDVDQMTIQKWKDILIADRTHRLSLQMTSSTSKTMNKSANISCTSITLTKSWPPSNNTSSSSSSTSSSNSDNEGSNSSSTSSSQSRSSSSSSSSSRRSTASLSPNLPVIQLSSSMSHQNLIGNTIKCPPGDNPDNNGDVDIRTHNDSNSPNIGNQTSFLISKPVPTIFPTRLFFCNPEETIFKALRLLLRFRLHHLPIMDSPFDGSGNILYVLTQRKLLTYMFEKLNKLPQPRFLQSSLTDLNIGTHQSILLITPSTRLADALLLFRENYITALPVVDSVTNRRLVNIFSKFDVFTLVLNGAYKNPDITIQEVLNICKTNINSFDETHKKPPVEICLASNNLLYVIEKLVKTGYRSLVIVNNTNEYRVDGIISLSDVLRFTVLQQLRITSCRSQPPSVAEVVDERDEINRREKQTTKKKKAKKETTDLLSNCSSETVIRNKKSDSNTKRPLSSHDTPFMRTLQSADFSTTSTPTNTTITTNITKTPITITTVTGGASSSPEHINTTSIHTDCMDSVKIIKSSKHTNKQSNKSSKMIHSLKADSDKITASSINIDSSNLCSDKIILPTIVSEKIT